MHSHVLGVLAFAAAASLAATGQGTNTPTFATDIAPLLQARCVSCHQPQGDAPFSLVTYNDVRQRARLFR